MPGFVVPVLIATLAFAVQVSAQQRTGYEGLLSWSALPSQRIQRSNGLASSWNRDGNNDDFNNYEMPSGHTVGDVDPVTVVSLDGPGLLTRFWMPHATANQAFPLRIVIDGSLAIDTDTDTLLGGGFAYFTDPLVSTLVGGQVSYEPILFQESLLIESANYSSPELRSRHYYQWSYTLFHEHAIVPSFTGVLTGDQQKARSQTIAMMTAAGDNPAGPAVGAIVINLGERSIDAGSSITIASVSGSGSVRRLQLMVSGLSDNALDGLRLQIRFDGHSNDAIDVPISHFFGVGHQRANFTSLSIGADPNGLLYSYWPMPYRTSLVIELYNSTQSPILLGEAEVEYEPRIVKPEEGVFHAFFSQKTTTEGQAFHSMLSESGSGHYVGNLLYIEDQEANPTILEGDDLIVVDGQTMISGTGTEDAYNGGYYYNHAYEQSDDGDVPNPSDGTGPLHGLLRMDFPDSGDDVVRVDQYRWMIAEAVPFGQQIEISVENHGQRGGVVFGSVVFYYLMLPSYLFSDSFEMEDLSNWSSVRSGL